MILCSNLFKTFRFLKNRFIRLAKTETNKRALIFYAFSLATVLFTNLFQLFAYLYLLVIYKSLRINLVGELLSSELRVSFIFTYFQNFLYLKFIYIYHNFSIFFNIFLCISIYFVIASNGTTILISRHCSKIRKLQKLKLIHKIILKNRPPLL